MVIQEQSDLQELQAALVLVVQLARPASKEKLARVAREVEQGQRASRAQLAVKGSLDRLGIPELQAKSDLLVRRVQWEPKVWLGPRVSLGQPEILVL